MWGWGAVTRPGHHSSWRPDGLNSFAFNGLIKNAVIRRGIITSGCAHTHTRIPMPINKPMIAHLPCYNASEMATNDGV